MSWIFYAVLAAAFWGVNYTLTEQVMKKLTIASVFVASGFVSLLFGLSLGMLKQTLSADWKILKAGGSEVRLLIAVAIVYLIANIFILVSIKSRNATMAGMVEISYPLFTAIFAWLFFQENQVTIGTIIGGSLIICGIGCIYFLDSA